MTKKATKSERAVIVCTDKRGVFFGYATGPVSCPAVRLTRVRMCVEWTKETKGVLGLAAKGPQKGCKVTDAIPAMDLPDVHAVIEVSTEAVARWEAGPWG